MQDDPRLSATPFHDPVPWRPLSTSDSDASSLELGLLARLHARHATERLFRVVLPGRGSLVPAMVYVSPGSDDLLQAAAYVDDADGARSDLPGGEVLHLLPPSLRRQLGALEPGAPSVSFHHEFPLAIAGARRRWAEVTGQAFRDDAETLVIEGAVREVTTLHRLRAADHEREARTRRMAEASSDVTMTVVRDSQLTVPWCSQNTLAVLGTNAQRLRGDARQLLERVHPEDRQLAEQALRSYNDVSAEMRWSGEIDDDEWHWIEMLVVPVRSDEEPRGALADVRIRLIDHQKHAQKVARQAARRVREADVALEQLEAVRRHVTRAVSHRVRTPLSVIQAATDTGLALASQLTPERLEGLFAQIDRASGALTKLLEDLLILPDADQLESLRPAPINLTDVVLTELSSVVHPHRRVEVQADTPVLALGVEEQCRRSLRHLLDNVVDHTPPDTVLSVGVRREGDVSVIDLRDDGPGVPTIVLDRLGEAFVTGGIDESNPGLGLGLAIADRLTRSQGGTLEVGRIEPKGTHVRLRLQAWPPSAAI